MNKIVRVSKRLADDPHRQAPDEFRLETEFDEVARLGLFQRSIRLVFRRQPGRRNRSWPRADVADHFSRPPNAPLTMKRMCLGVDGARRLFSRAESNPSWS